MRILGATRLSNDTDASTSIERQREAIALWVKMHGHTLVSMTQDVDVSGAVPPAGRPDLGPWLNGKAGQWDTIVVWKIDRLTRSLRDFTEFVAWCQANGKSLVSISENIDLTTVSGRLAADLLVRFGQFERETIGDRVADARRKGRSKAHWQGGQGIPFGYRPVKVGTHHELVIDDAQAGIVRRLARMIIDGSSIRAACNALNAEGITTAKGKQWSSATVSAMLRNATLRGYVMHDGQVVTGDDGMPVKRDAILDDDTWHALQSALERITRKDSGIRHGGALLLRVLFCGQCGQPLYRHARKDKGDRYRHGPNYQPGCNGSFSLSATETMVTDALMSTLGNLPMRKLTLIKGNDVSAEIGRIDERLADLEKQYVAGNVSADMFGRMVKALDSKRAELAAQPVVADREEYRETGQTFAQFWAGLDDESRHVFLLDNKVRASITRGTVTDPACGKHVTEVSDGKITVTVEYSHLLTLLGR